MGSLARKNVRDIMGRESVYEGAKTVRSDINRARRYVWGANLKDTMNIRSRT